MERALQALTTRLEAIGQLSSDDRARLAALPFNVRNIRKGEEIIADGEMSHSCCLVVSGYVYRSKTLANGNRQIFSLHMAGDVPDLHSLHLHRMDHNLAAMSDGQVAQVPHRALTEMLDAAPHLNGLLWRDTLIDAAAFRAWMLMLGQAEAGPRMAHHFCELYTRASMAGLTTGNSFGFPLTQQDLGDVLGISIVHANRTLQDLRARGLVEFDQQTVTILRWDALRAYGQFDPAYLHYLDDRVGRVDPAVI
jgi:CRP-like cAMP-binding protein